MDDENSYYIAAVVANKIIGVLTSELQVKLHRSKKQSFIEDLIVDKNYRGKGIGKALLENAVEYKWLFQVKSQLFQLLALLYFTMDDIKNTKNALSNSVFYYLSHSNHTHYDNFEFYSFRPISDYLLDSISHNYITLTNPQQFNDPVDPALLSHLDYLINHTKNEKDKELYMLQKEVYSKVRIRCLVRSLPLPQKEGRDVSVVNDSERERNFTTMWAYYADYHRGICIKYVFPSTLTSHETNKDAVLILNNVEYKKIYNPDNIHFNLNDALFGKGEHWQYEHECRFVYFHRHKEDEYMKINIPEECITEIYIGVRTSLEDKLKLKEALKNKPNIKLFQMRISNSNLFQLDVETLDREKWLNDI